MTGTGHADDPLIAAVEQRVGWAREALASDDYTGMEKVWMRRYEMDVSALVARLVDAEELARRQAV